MPLLKELNYSQKATIMPDLPDLEWPFNVLRLAVVHGDLLSPCSVVTGVSTAGGVAVSGAFDRDFDSYREAIVQFPKKKCR